MYFKTFSLAVLMLSAFSAHAATKKLVCFQSWSDDKTPMGLELNTKAARLTFKKKQCAMKRISYNPTSSKYEGWIRFGTDKKECPAFGHAMFGDSSIFKKPMRVYWISVSSEAQSGEKGYAQLGFENDADPGAGPEAKLGLRCYPPRK